MNGHKEINLAQEARLRELEPQVRPFEVDTLGKAEWASAKVVEAQNAIERIKEHVAVHVRQLEEWAEGQTKEWTNQIEFFSPLIQKWGREHMAEYTKKRSLDLANGIRIGFRAGSTTVEIEDDDAAVAECRKYNLDDAVKVVEKPIKSAIKKHMEAGVLLEAAKLNKKDETFYVKNLRTEAPDAGESPDHLRPADSDAVEPPAASIF